jgi:hypothetical protein
LIYHQSYDYDFYAYRTDFTGDSGVGKSLIADLLQLIFVGSDEFKSATLSDGTRQPRTMVFQRPNRGVDMGYAFLNIEKSHNKFIVIGVYIQNNEERVKSFIIQQGQDFSKDFPNNLIPFDKPVSYNDLIQENNILSLEECKKYLLEKYMYMEQIGHQRFFSILSKNGILPIETENYKEAVKIYGEIIRTFARGNKISFSKDHELKRFLFGDEGKNEILKQFEKAEREINESITTHESILEDIDKIDKNLKDLESLLKLKRESDDNYKKWVNAKIGFCKFQASEAKGILEGHSQQIADGLNRLSLFKDFLNAKSTELEDKQTILSEKLENWTKISTDYQNLVKLNKWLKFHSETNPQKLKQIYIEHNENKKTQKQLTELNKLLFDNKILEYFKKSKWTEGFDVGFEWSRNQINELEKDLESKKAFEAFSNLENKDSLAYWAVNNYTSFTREQESILMYFQTLSTKKYESPKIKDRFSYNPTIFFEKPVIDFKDDNGFYLNLGGINEYILYDKERKLSSGNIHEIRDYFSKLNVSIKNDIYNIETELKEIKALFECLKSIPELVNSYNNSSKIANFKFNTDFDSVSEIELVAIINIHANKQQIEYDFNSKTTFAQRKQKIIEDLPKIKALIIAVNKLLKNKESYESIANEYKVELPISQIKSELDFGISHSEWETFFDSIRIPSLERYEEVVKDWIVKDKKLEQIKNEFKGTEINFSQVEFFKNSTETLEANYKKSKLTYESKYDEIAKRELNELEYLKIKDNYDFLELGKEIYPDIIKDIKDLADKDVIDAISNSLSQIAEKAKEFTKNKSNSLRTILQDFLLSKIETYKRLQKNIQTFFTTQKKLGNLISNEFEVKLSLDEGEFEQKWIIDSIATSFEDYNEFKNIISFKEFALKVFRRMSDYDLQKDISIEKILNPNSYFRLNYKMTKTDGWDNVGISTGQNYAMVALLCIARLSIIEKQSSNRSKQQNGVRFMPIDEAEGLGSNFDLLYKIAKDKGYQIVTMSIGTLDFLEEGNQTIYILHRNLEETKRPVNYPPEKISTNLIEEDEVHEMEIFKSFE